MSKRKSSTSMIASSEVTRNLVEYDGDLSKLNGELLAGWFVAHPNGPTAFALGFVEFENSRRMFYKWMHFTGGKTWLSQELASYFTHSVAEGGKYLILPPGYDGPLPRLWLPAPRWRRARPAGSDSPSAICLLCPRSADIARQHQPVRFVPLADAPSLGAAHVCLIW
jgi:hypothetical protein